MLLPRTSFREGSHPEARNDAAVIQLLAVACSRQFGCDNMRKVFTAVGRRGSFGAPEFEPRPLLSFFSSRGNAWFGPWAELSEARSTAKSPGIKKDNADIAGSAAGAAAAAGGGVGGCGLDFRNFYSSANTTERKQTALTSSEAAR